MLGFPSRRRIPIQIDHDGVVGEGGGDGGVEAEEGLEVGGGLLHAEDGVEGTGDGSGVIACGAGV